MCLQAYTQASRHSTTILRDHGSQTRDVSNISNEDAVKFFPDDIAPIGLGDRLISQLADNPSFLIQGLSGLQPLIQQAMQDKSLSYGDFGSKDRTIGSVILQGFGQEQRKVQIRERE